MCGEHALIASRNSLRWGSSPHVRGTPQARLGVLSAPGIIPACAGNTEALEASIRKFGDHPRMCGEHLGKQLKAVSHAGSSPHVRGTP